HFNSNSVCGINRGTYTDECSITNGGDNIYVNCSTDKATNNFHICCYNFEIGNKISVQSLKVDFPNTIGNLASATIYNASNQINVNDNPFSISTNQDNAVDPLASFAKITSFVYEGTNQKGGFGRAIMTISLSRDPVRFMRVSVIGRMKELIIPGTTPRC